MISCWIWDEKVAESIVIQGKLTALIRYLTLIDAMTAEFTVRVIDKWNRNRLSIRLLSVRQFFATNHSMQRSLHNEKVPKCGTTMKSAITPLKNREEYLFLFSVPLDKFIFGSNCMFLCSFSSLVLWFGWTLDIRLFERASLHCPRA